MPWEPTVNRDDEFRRNAAEAQRSARRARTDDERANWVQLAEGWLGLLRKGPQSRGAFDIKIAAKNNGKTIRTLAK
jgi:hypothetical protein